MGELARKAAGNQPPKDNGKRNDLPQKDGLSPDEQKALDTIQREAKKWGSFLTSGGKGGLDPRLVLRVMQRDEYHCKSCGELGDKEENGGIGVHHVGGIVSSRRTSKLGHKNQLNNLVTICARCHDREHERARAEGEDSSQVTPSGDRGNPKRDHGLPPAKVDR